MDKLNRYRALLRRIVSERAAIIDRQPVSGQDTCVVFDTEHDHYILLTLGWREQSRVRGASLHVRIKNGKFWIEEDLTEEGIANQLMEAGVPKEDIVLAFQHPEMRPLTEFAVA